MLYNAYKGTKSREKLIKLIDVASSKTVSYHILNCTTNATATCYYQIIGFLHSAGVSGYRKFFFTSAIILRL